jgi:hypothetical protein
MWISEYLCGEHDSNLTWFAAHGCGTRKKAQLAKASSESNKPHVKLEHNLLRCTNQCHDLALHRQKEEEKGKPKYPSFHDLGVRLVVWAENLHDCAREKNLPARSR